MGTAETARLLNLEVTSQMSKMLEEIKLEVSVRKSYKQYLQ